MLKDDIWKQFEKNVIGLFDIGTPNIFGNSKDAVLRACDEVSEENGYEKQKRYTWGGMKR